MSELVLVTINDAMALARVSRRTIYNWLAKEGRLEYVRTAGGAVRIVASSLFRDGTVGVVAEAVPEPAGTPVA